jgi:integrase/recombinase XerD
VNRGPDGPGRYRTVPAGHESLESTQLYTQVSIRKLQDIYLATHPAAKLRPRGAGEEHTGVDRADLLARLDVEGEEDGEEPGPFPGGRAGAEALEWES